MNSLELLVAGELREKNLKELCGLLENFRGFVDEFLWVYEFELSDSVLVALTGIYIYIYFFGFCSFCSCFECFLGGGFWMRDLC